MKSDKAVLEKQSDFYGPTNVSEAGMERDHLSVRRTPSILQMVWRGWLRLAEAFGTFQMVLILSLVYWTLLAVMAVPFRLFADPLGLRSASHGGWVQRSSVSTLDAMRKQY
ncbi:MAG: hypothetical protein O7C75_08565 [Verrucomicrobia bacterium]|nr:hypothetical protein [Verrucomicrobiota bacterium]